MIETKVSRRYAKSLLDLANEKGALEEVNRDMKLIHTVGVENHDLELMLISPVIHSDKKQNVLHQVFAGKLNALTLAFIDIVIRKGREKYLMQIAKEFGGQYRQFKGIQSAEIISAVGLDDNLRRQVYDIVKNSTKSEVELTEKVDNKLIGGFILRLGDKQFDASVASSLRKLTQTFASNPYIKKN